jgi:anti-sigma B factor antagonist
LNVAFRVEADPGADLHTVSVIGELDQATAPQLRSALGDALGVQSTPVLVDLTDCGFIDSTGLSLLVEAKRRLAEDDRQFAVCCPDADVRRLLELTGIDEAVGLFDSKDEAVAALSDRSAA